jgi:hypothetical protein
MEESDFEENNVKNFQNVVIFFIEFLSKVVKICLKVFFLFCVSLKKIVWVCKRLYLDQACLALQNIYNLVF